VLTQDYKIYKFLNSGYLVMSALWETTPILRLA